MGLFQYVQVNTFEPPPPPITSMHPTPTTNHLAYQNENFQSSAIPQTPHYARLPRNEFNFDSYATLGWCEIHYQFFVLFICLNFSRSEYGFNREVF